RLRLLPTPLPPRAPRLPTPPRSPPIRPLLLPTPPLTPPLRPRALPPTAPPTLPPTPPRLLPTLPSRPRTLPKKPRRNKALQHAARKAAGKPAAFRFIRIPLCGCARYSTLAAFHRNGPAQRWPDIHATGQADPRQAAFGRTS